MLNTIIEKIGAWIIRIQRIITATLIVGMILVVLSQIVFRYFFALPTPWAEEIARILMIWIVFIGSAGMLVKGEHLCVDVFYRYFGDNVKKVIRIIYDAVILAFVIFVAIYAFRLLANPVIYKSFTPIARLPLGCILFELTDLNDSYGNI